MLSLSSGINLSCFITLFFFKSVVSCWITLNICPCGIVCGILLLTHIAQCYGWHCITNGYSDKRNVINVVLFFVSLVVYILLLCFMSSLLLNLIVVYNKGRLRLLACGLTSLVPRVRSVRRSALCEAKNFSQQIGLERLRMRRQREAFLKQEYQEDWKPHENTLLVVTVREKLRY